MHSNFYFKNFKQYNTYIIHIHLIVFNNSTFKLKSTRKSLLFNKKHIFKTKKIPLLYKFYTILKTTRFLYDFYIKTSRFKQVFLYIINIVLYFKSHVFNL